MEHLLVHRLEVLRRQVTGEEDGTPIMSDWEPVPWGEGDDAPLFGACRLDTPRDGTTQATDGSTVTVERSDVLCGLNCPVKPMDRLRITTDLFTQEWKPGVISDAGGMHGAHHLEVKVTREVHR